MSKYENDINELFNDEPFTRELLDSIGFSCSATEFYQNLLTLKYGTQDVCYEYNFKLALEEYKIKEENKDREVNLIKTNATENLVSSNFSHYPREETKYVEDNDNSSSSSVSFIKKITSSPVTKSHNYEDISTVKIGFLKVDCNNKQCYLFIKDCHKKEIYRSVNVSSDRVQDYVKGDFICINNKVLLFGYLQKDQINTSVIEFELTEANSVVKKIDSSPFIEKAIQTIFYANETHFLLSGGTNEIGTEMSNENWIVPLRLNEKREGAKFVHKRSHHCLVQFNNSAIYAFGGIYYDGEKQCPEYSIERIHPANLFEPTRNWEVIQIIDPKYEFCFIKSVAIPFSKRILIFGGIKLNLKSFSRNGYTFDPISYKITNYLNIKNSDEKQDIVLSHSCKMLCSSVIIENFKPVISSPSFDIYEAAKKSNSTKLSKLQQMTKSTLDNSVRHILLSKYCDAFS